MNYKWCMAHIDEGFCTMYFAETREELEEKMLAMVKESMLTEEYCTDDQWPDIENDMLNNINVRGEDYALSMTNCWVFSNLIGWDERWYIREIV